ncbi:ATP-binding cassette subfamily C protein LapB [Pseudomonas sp. JAI115]|uniref:type I secretion system permease/ATPase n=1 Tax=Pseudomonas sp. JAI115 TaxID=2723061 RepID=UPI0016127F1B|nr:type I secretion system permease/ATPase [Pseudomonas sp. JAI115]MBB6155239.1 ATP-binding cassette subfamily C protein LapB [Pseudomonas sp. JAI115]
MSEFDGNIDLKKWIAAWSRVGASYGHPVDPEYLAHQMTWHESDTLEQKILRLSSLVNLQAKIKTLKKVHLSPQMVPFVIARNDGQLAVVEAINADGSLMFWLTDSSDLQYELAAEDFWSHASGMVVLLTPALRGRDSRVDEFVKPYEKHWLVQGFRGTGHKIIEVSLASLVSNVLALAGILFSMQVYDRVIPAESYNTLWVLFIGVLIAAIFEFLIRIARTRASDIMGKNADLKISAYLFARAMAIRNEARPKSTGSFISQIREVDHVREMITSSTVGAAADMPFVLVFLGIMAMIGGPLVWIPLLAIPLVIIPGLLLQWPLARLSREGMRESALKSAVLVETIEGIEDIKALQAEPYFQRVWKQNHEISADIGIKQRFWGGMLSGWGGLVQQLSYSAMLVLGVYFVLKGEMTTGTLVACSLLSSRTLSPLMQLTMVFSRWQHAKVAMNGLDELLKKPVDLPPEESRAHCPHLLGNYQLNHVQYAYDYGQTKSILDIADLRIAQGERVAILGRVGAGKSTLLKLLAGQGMPTQGKVTLDGVDLSLIDPMDVRAQVGFLAQDSRLFFGSLRQNLLMGHPHATEQEMLDALSVSGALSMLQRDASILDQVIHEGGRGLSGGQKQMILLSRMLLRNPKIVLLDEPTSNMDEGLEQEVLKRLDTWVAGRTLVVVTHRPALLKIVKRLVIVEGGRVIDDGPRDKVLKKYSAPADAAAMVPAQKATK